jgi:hypothetical protein
VENLKNGSLGAKMKKRKMDLQIVEYLGSLKDQLETLSEESPDHVDILVENVFLETKTRMASAASEQHSALRAL